MEKTNLIPLDEIKYSQMDEEIEKVKQIIFKTKNVKTKRDYAKRLIEMEEMRKEYEEWHK